MEYLNYPYLCFINGLYTIFFVPFEISNGSFMSRESFCTQYYFLYDNFHSKFRMEYHLYGLHCNRFCLFGLFMFHAM